LLAGLIAEVALAVILAGILFRMLELRLGAIGGAIYLLEVPFWIYFINPDHRVYSFHGFWHHAITYSILNLGVPPPDPLAAGQPLLYPWGMHLVAAGTSRLLGVSPPMSFAILNSCCLVIEAALVFGIARVFRLASPAAMLAALIPVLGITPLNFGNLAILVQPYLPFAMEFRGTPVLAQFTHVNGASFGIVAYTAALFCLLRIFADERKVTPRVYMLLVAATACGGFFYPLQYVGLMGAASCGIGAMAIRGARRAAVVGASGALLAGTAIVLPYLLLIASGKAPSATIGVEASFRGLAEDAYRHLLTCAVPLAVLVWQREWFAGFLRNHVDAAILLFAAAGATGVLYVVGHYPETAEYKLQTLSALTWGIFLGIGLAAIYEHRRWAAFVITSLVLLPLASDILVKTDPGRWRITDPYVEDGILLEAAEPAEKELYRWIRDHTRPADAFVDTQLTIPVFAQRPVFYGMNTRPHEKGRPDGWFASPNLILRVLEGLPTHVLDQRQALARSLMFGAELPADLDEAIELGQFSGSDLFVVARRAKRAAMLSADVRFEPVFWNRAGAIFRVKRKESGAFAP
jgi:hypothetical protein